MSASAADKSLRVRRLSGHKPPKVDVVRNDINVTPLVDVMLVLLIIFMLMTLVMGRGHDVKLPAAQHFSQEKDKMQPVVTIEADGTLYLKADSKVEYSKVYPVLEYMNKQMAMSNVDLAITKSEDK